MGDNNSFSAEHFYFCDLQITGSGGPNGKAVLPT